MAVNIEIILSLSLLAIPKNTISLISFLCKNQGVNHSTGLLLEKVYIYELITLKLDYCSALAPSG